MQQLTLRRHAGRVLRRAGAARSAVAAVVLAFACAAPSVVSAEILLRYNFDAPQSPWPAAATDVRPDTPLPIHTAVSLAPVGSINEHKSDVRSGAVLMTAEVGELSEPWQAVFTSGLLPVRCTESNLGKITLSFDLSASAARPVLVRVESFDAQKRRTGGLETYVYPAAPDFLLRSALDLDRMIPVGDGRFNPTDPHVQFSFVIAGPHWPSSTTHSVRLDNLCYATPAFYVSPSGNNAADGKTEATALADPQKAVDRAKPGDIIVLMGGEYLRGPDNDEQNGNVEFTKGGEPDAWVVLKNYPAQTPVLRLGGWSAIRLGRAVKADAPQPPPMAYIEIRGIHVRGDADTVMQKHADDIGLPKWTTNGNGISGTGAGRTLPPHHLRVADCLVEYVPGGGIGVSEWDYVAYENNVSRNNCWFTIYATSGMGTLGTANFDAVENVYKVLFRNNRISWNRCYIAWKQIGKLSDGNGLIIDSTVEKTKGLAYIGRTLIQNNVSTHNGGSGIHCFKAQRVDVVNNTAYMNGATPQLAWGQIFFQRTDDARMINNVLWARDNQPVNTVGNNAKNDQDKGNTNVLRANNVYFNGNFPIMGESDLVADPRFVSAGYHLDTSDFRLLPESPARRHGRWEPFVPITDIDGKLRPLDVPPDAGAFQN